MNNLNLSEPSFSKNVVQSVSSILAKGLVSSVCDSRLVLEENLRSRFKCSDCVAVSSGSEALRASLQVFRNLSGQSTFNVWCSDYTFVATANALSAVGAEIVFITVDQFGEVATDVGAHIACLPDLVVIVLPHGDVTAGVMKLCEFCERNKVPFLIDAAAGILVDLEPFSSFSMCVCCTLSFNGNKVITGGGGGAILTWRKQFGCELSLYCGQYKLSGYDHSGIGFNSLLPALNSELINQQFEHIEELYASRKWIAEQYDQLVHSLPYSSDIKFVKMSDGASVICRSYWISGFWFIGRPLEFDKLVEKIREAGVLTQRFWRPLTHTRAYRNYASLGESSSPLYLPLPSSAFLGESEVARVCAAVEQSARSIVKGDRQ